MAAVTGSAIYSFLSIRETLARGAGSNIRSVRGAELISSALVEQRTSFWLLLAGSEQDAQETYSASWKEFDEGIDLTSAPDVSPSVLQTSTELRHDAARYRAEADHLMKGSLLRPQAGAQQVVTQTLEPQIVRLRKLATDLGEAGRQATLSEASEERSATTRAIWRAVAVTAIAFGLAVLLGFRLVKTAVTPLAELAQRAGRIAEGDLEPKTHAPRKDEIGALNEAFESMASSIREARRVNRRRLQRAEQMSDAALEYLYDPVVVLDHHARIVHLNQAAETLLGKIPEGVRVPVKEHIEDRRLSKALAAAALSKTVSAGEDETSLMALKSANSTKTYRLRTTPIGDEEGISLGSVAVLEDVTHMREIDRLKNEFIGVASHELRTPVSSLLLSAQLLKDGAVGELNPSQKQVVDMQLQDLERLEKLMRDLLDVTKLEAGTARPKLQKVPAAEIIGSTVEMLKPQASKKGVVLETQVPSDLGTVTVDRVQVGRVLTNLIANAIRHTSAAGFVRVSADGAKNDVTFHVKDSGEGIPPDYLARIFDRFVQVPGATQGGAGLGLSIAQNIVKAHGGQMSVESKVGEGSVFSFTLPRDSQALGEESVS